ncbi:copper-binding protein [Labrenzia sp. PHM005]|uniref:copper-binding protein n=1 Tax=Labrenzia sp. PHM005 TaxID=2590016 RepID=UPI00114027F9|nr:copper-binding protein [Labrenzia sp. PHM005]QDG78163.1 copper-binding protein [Labrenzia sp. PHM005]
MKLIKNLALATIVAASTAPAAIADSKHGSDHSGMDHSNMAMNVEQMEGAVHTKAVVNSLGDGTANVTHDPIPEIGWPAMTMDFTVVKGAKMMGDIKTGDTVTLMLMKGEDGLYAIGAIMPN